MRGEYYLFDLHEHAVIGVENLTGDLQERLEFVGLVRWDFIQ